MTNEQAEAEELASELDMPIQVGDVCELLLSEYGFNVSYEEKNLSTKGFEGISLGDSQGAGIIVNSNIRHPTRKRFTAMHEIGHVTLHIFTEIKAEFRCSKTDIFNNKKTQQVGILHIPVNTLSTQ